MMPKWCTSDTHFGHANMAKSSYSEWRSTWACDGADMDHQLIQAWNQTVDARDWVLHLGDFCFATVERTIAFRRALKGRILLVCGNHDRSPKRMRELGFDHCVKEQDIVVDGIRVLCAHEPAKLLPFESCWDLLLHGHCHGAVPTYIPEDVRHKFVDVGIDARRSKKPARLADLVHERIGR